MPRFFTDSPADDIIRVTGSDARHIGYSLRMKIGERITFCHNGIDYITSIEAFSDGDVICRVEYSEPSRSEPSVFLTLYQALPKQDKLEFIIQKATELGASRIVPFISARCISRPDKVGFEKKLERSRRIALEAAKQSGRGIVPEVASLMTFDEALSDMRSNELSLFCYENGGKRLGSFSIPESGRIAVMIGSEGGFERSEAEAAESSGAVRIWLGERILRCETCPAAVISIIMNLTGNM